MRVLLLRSAPTWNCCTQPRAWSRSARRWSSAERKTRASPASSARPARSRANSAGGLGVRERLGVEPLEAVVRGAAAALVEEARGASRAPRAAPPRSRSRREAAASSFSSQAVQARGPRPARPCPAARSGRPGSRGPCALASRACGSSESIGSSVVQTTATLNCASRPSAVKPSCCSLLVGARRRRRAPWPGRAASSMPNGRRSSIARPVVERVAERLRHRARPGLELVEVRRVARAEPLRDAVRAHRAPLVVVALEPDLGDRAEAVVARHQLRREVAVVVDDRQVLGGAVVELARRLALEQEVVVDEGLHGGLAQAVFSTGIGSNFGASTWWIANDTRYAKAQMPNRMV